MKESYKDKIKGIISEEQFLEFNQLFLNEKQISQTLLNELTGEIEALEEEKHDTEALKKKIEKYLAFDELTGEVVNAFIEEIRIGEKDKETKQQIVEIDWSI